MDRSPCSATAEYSVARTTRLDTSSASSDEPSRQDSAVVVGIGPTSLPAVTAEHGGDDSSYTLAAVADDQPPGARAAGTSEHGNTTSRRRLGRSPGRDEHLWLPLGVNAGGPPPRAVHRTARGGWFTEQQCILSTTSTVMVTLPSGFGSTRSRALGADLTHSVVHSRGAALRRRGTDDGPRRHSDRGHDTVRFIPGRIVGSGHGIGLGRSVQMGASHPCRRTEAAALAAAAATGDVGVNWRCTHPSGPRRPRRRRVAAAR